MMTDTHVVKIVGSIPKPSPGGAIPCVAQSKSYDVDSSPVCYQNTGEAEKVQKPGFSGFIGFAPEKNAIMGGTNANAKSPKTPARESKI